VNKNTLLAIDIGNTRMTLGLFKRGMLQRKTSIPTAHVSKKRLGQLAFLKKSKIDIVLIASVVPKKSVVVKKTLRSLLKVPVLILGKDLTLPIRNRTNAPSQVGTDRLVNALAAFERFKKPCIAVDFGTAITLDVISKKGDYLGGCIAPGIELTLNSLYENTALLPRIKLNHPRSVIGKSTVESIQSGCAYGLGSLCDGLINQISRSTKTVYRIIATGGYARPMSRYMKRLDAIDEDLSLKGINTVYRLRK
jgi:type III pantothenate kinase